MGDKSRLLFSRTVRLVLKKGTVQAFNPSFFCGSARSEILPVVLERAIKSFGEDTKKACLQSRHVRRSAGTQLWA